VDRGEDVKASYYRKLVALVLFTLALSGAVLAQDFSHKVRANIPFDFYAGEKMLPAGTYTLAINRGSNNVAMFQTYSGVGTFLLGSPHDASRNGLSQLVFRSNREGKYVLQTIEGPDLGLSFASRKALSNVALEQPASQTEVVVIAVGK
jgi:hypothetical protein